jgi:hypothetical protein
LLSDTHLKAQESTRVFRRLAASLMLWVGVLALSSPVLACGASMMPGRDCCPEGTHAPCDNGGVPKGIAACCSAAPIVSQAAAVEPSRIQHEQPLNSGTPDPLILSAWFHTFDARAVPLLLIPWSEGSPARDATLTYLHTGRLRL